MALEPDDSPAALNRDLRIWVKNWTGKGIGQVALGANISNSRAYAATANTNLVPRDLLLAIVRAAVPITYDSEQRTDWIRQWSREWERRWERAEATTRGERPRDLQPDPAIQQIAEPPARPNRAVRLDPRLAMPALDRITDVTVRAITSEYVFVTQDPLLVGYHKRSPITVYIDLHSASCSSHHRESLAQFLARRVRRKLGGLDPDRTVIATAREGNILVGNRVAELCGVPFLMVRTTSRPPRFGYAVERTFGDEIDVAINNGVEAIIVDDIVMGSLNSKVAKLLRVHEGIATRNCFSIFERADLSVQDRLADADLVLDSAFTIDDDLVADLKRRAEG
ncbi:phosphoribosyltransferase [Nocardioides sp. NPDC057577]|uniref:phosphoribosyltransferase n=1 Tax=Nocardioides sp. NPDC057577 TaxID=3346171 RepID=UPI00367285B3